jgi:hypothetical protein
MGHDERVVDAHVAFVADYLAGATITDDPDTGEVRATWVGAGGTYTARYIGVAADIVRAARDFRRIAEQCSGCAGIGCGLCGNVGAV